LTGNDAAPASGGVAAARHGQALSLLLVIVDGCRSQSPTSSQQQPDAAIDDGHPSHLCRRSGGRRQVTITLPSGLDHAWGLFAVCVAPVFGRSKEWPRMWTVICDFDGTIVPFDVTDRLLDQFADPAWQFVEEAWKHGRISALRCMSLQVAMIRATQVELDAFLESVDVDPHFPTFVADCRHAGMPIAVVSDGLDYVIDRILKRHRITGLKVFANRLVPGGDGTYTMAAPYAVDGCMARSGVCKCNRAAGLTPRGHHTLLIGDGRSDFCLGETADLVFARGALLRKARDQGWPAVDVPDFAAARLAFARLIGRLAEVA
jgi:2,3-diketo-5-methylthio-1-phosphopentane phosphatase